MEKYITISLEEYRELIYYKQKSEQYKNYLLENTQNNQLTKALCVIECKNLYQLVTEKQEKEKKKNE